MRLVFDASVDNFLHLLDFYLQSLVARLEKGVLLLIPSEVPLHRVAPLFEIGLQPAHGRYIFL